MIVFFGVGGYKAAIGVRLGGSVHRDVPKAVQRALNIENAFDMSLLSIGTLQYAQSFFAIPQIPKIGMH